MTRPQSIERIREALEIDLRYPKLNPEKLGDDYMRHVMAMTREGLHSKSSIAEQLAWRDQSIKELLTYLEGVERDAARYKWLRDKAYFVGSEDDSDSPWIVAGTCYEDSRPIFDKEVDLLVDAAIAKEPKP